MHTFFTKKDKGDIILNGMYALAKISKSAIYRQQVNFYGNGYYGSVSAYIVFAEEA